MSLKNTREGGYTIIEALVAIAILLLSIAGPMTIAMQGIKQGTHARDQVTAFYLGQEAIELVRASRDNHALQTSGNSWTDGLPVCADGCTIDAADPVLRSCGAPQCGTVVYNPDGLVVNSAQRGVFTHVSGAGTAATVFSRIVTITQAAQAGEYIVDAKVSWASRLNPETPNVLTVRSRIFDLYDNI